MVPRGLVFLFTFLGAMLVVASPPTSLEQLNQVDQKIYESTFAKCRPGTVASALKLGFDKDAFISGVNNWLQISSFNLNASEARAKARGLNPQISELRNSQGFWLAMTDCYGYKYGEVNYGNLMKQIIDASHLTIEVGSTSVGIVALIGGAKTISELSKAYPIATRFVMSSLVAIQISIAIQQIQNLTSTELSLDEQKQLAETQSRLFAEPNEAIQEAIMKSQLVIERINEKLKDPHLSKEKRARLILNREKILATLKKLPQHKAGV